MLKINVLFIIGAYQGLLMTLVLMLRKPNRFANSFLGLLLLFLALSFLDGYFGLHDLKYPQFTLKFILLPLSTIYGMFVYHYTRAMVQNLPRIRIRPFLIHMIPFIVTLIGYSFIVLRFDPLPISNEAYHSMVVSNRNIFMIVISFNCVSGLLYTLASLRIFNRYRIKS